MCVIVKVLVPPQATKTAATQTAAYMIAEELPECWVRPNMWLIETRICIKVRVTIKKTVTSLEYANTLHVSE